MTSAFAVPTARHFAGLPGRVVFGALVLIAILAFVYSVTRRIRVLMAGAPENRFDRIGTRVWKTLEYAFAQKRMFRDFYAGVFHILIFGGFVVLIVRSLALVVEGLVPGFVLLPGAARPPTRRPARSRTTPWRWASGWRCSAAPSLAPRGST